MKHDPQPRAMRVKQVEKSAKAENADKADEVELKLQLAPADAQTFRRLALLKDYATAPPRTLRLHSTYFDTPDQHLRQQGLELRVRHIGKTWTQTLKSTSSATGGLYQRMERETPVSGLRPDLAALVVALTLPHTPHAPHTRYAEIIGVPALAKQLRPVFSNTVRRTLWPLHLPDGSLVEMALDLGELCAGDAREPICEVELELKAGQPAALYAFALQLQEKARLRLNNRSKSARGYALMAPSTISPIAVVCAKDMTLHPSMTLEQGFQCMAQNCLAQIQGNESGVMHGVDPESVHQMRVGLRRLRSALRLFSRWIALPKDLRSGINSLTNALGTARDAEVFAQSTLPALAATAHAQDTWVPLQQVASTAARTHRQRAAQEVGSARYARLMLGLVAWAYTAGWQRSLDASARKKRQQPIDSRATALLTRLHKKLCAAGQKLAKSTPAERHRVRIAAKRLRYATEFFASLYRPKRVKRYVKRLTALQDALGRINDAAVAQGMLRQIAKLDRTTPAKPQTAPHIAPHAALTDSIRLAKTTLSQGSPKNMRDALRRWKQFDATKPMCAK